MLFNNPLYHSLEIDKYLLTKLYLDDFIKILNISILGVGDSICLSFSILNVDTFVRQVTHSSLPVVTI